VHKIVLGYEKKVIGLRLNNNEGFLDHDALVWNFSQIVCGININFHFVCQWVKTFSVISSYLDELLGKLNDNNTIDGLLSSNNPYAPRNIYRKNHPRWFQSWKKVFNRPVCKGLLTAGVL